MSSRSKTLLSVVGLFLVLGLLVYGRSLGNDFVRWDDGMLIYENPAVREISPWSLKRIFTTYDPELYIPLTFISYQIDYKISGTSAFSYHLTSLLLHIANALLVAWLVYLLVISDKRLAVSDKHESKTLTASRLPLAALFIGLLFLLHPLHTEAVAWASGRKDVLSTFFFLLSLIAYVHVLAISDKRLAISDKYEGQALTASRLPLAASSLPLTAFRFSLLFFILGLLSKVMIITLPVVLLLIDYLQRRKLSVQMFTEKIPYVAIAAVFGVIAIFGKTGVVASSTLWQKILMACMSSVFYLKQIFAPLHFSLLYPYTKAITLASPDFFIPVMVVAMLLIIVWWCRFRAREVTFGILFYFLTLAPTFINFAKGGELDIYFASDRYAYVPSIGVFFLIVSCVLYLSHRRTNEQTKQRTNVVMLCAAIILPILAFLSYRQSRVWRDTESLFANVIAAYPDSSHVAHNNLGNMHRLRKEIDQSIEEYKKAISIRPHPKTYCNLGAAYRTKGDLHAALDAYAAALKIDPHYPLAHIGLGIIDVDQGKLDDAEREYKEGLHYDPKNVTGWTNLGVLYTNEGRLAEAVAAYRQALKVNPYFTEAHYNLAVTLTKQNDPAGAIDEYREVLHSAPTFIPARINLALLLYKQGDTDDARAMFQSVLAIDPRNAAARSALEQLGGS